jgi:hypothetical protein
MCKANFDVFFFLYVTEKVWLPRNDVGDCGSSARNGRRHAAALQVLEAI